MSAGISGHLLSTAFLAATLERMNLQAGAALPARSQVGPASSLRSLLDAGLAPLLENAGLDPPCDVEISYDTLIASVVTEGASIVLLVTRWGAPLHLAWRAAVEHAIRRSARWAVVFNGSALRILDAARAHSARFIEFHLDTVADSAASASAFRFILGQLGGSLESVIRESDEHGVSVCRALRHGVLSASSDVLAALARPRRSHESLQAALDQSLTIVYRVLFLLFAESRGLVPLWHPLYRDSYSIDALVTAASRAEDSRGLWDALRAIARLAHSGCHAGDLRVTAFNGRLFSPARTPLAERRGLDDERARRALLSLATQPGRSGAGRERITYRDLGVEQLGSVYESLLDYQPAAHPVSLVPGSGIRKSTGTFYTPQPLAEYLVRHTLGPLVRQATPQHILDLRVVDPSMGSGAFLVAACHYLAQAYEHALVREGTCHPGDVTDSERAGIRRMIAERCLYGVDINPMAVQLARLSLWLTTLAADRPLTFLDHHLRTGDSLLGAWLENLRRRPSGAARRHRRDERSGHLFDDMPVKDMLRQVLPVRFSLEHTPDDSLDQVRGKERALAALEDGESAVSRWKRVADVWCAAWLSAGHDAVPAAAFNDLAGCVLGGGCALPRHIAARYLAVAAAIASGRRLFHWELEFPEAFFEASGRRLPRAGFDAVIGNPPWEVVRGDDPALRFHRRSGVFSSSTTGHGNLYQVFAERAITLLREGGRLGLVLPAGLATDHNAAPLRRHLFHHCDVDTLVGFDNRRGVFAIHRSVKFLLTTGTRGTPTTSIATRLGESDIASLEASPDDSLASSPWFRVRLTPALLERVSGESLAIPELRADIDVAIVERAAALFPAIGSADGWAATFGRELNATDDRRHFGSSGLPVVDGKHIAPFRVNVAASHRFIAASTARRRLGSAPFDRARLAYRDVASATNKVTLIAAILPAGCVSTHTLFCLRNPLPPGAQHYLCGLFNSLVVNYLVRMRVTTHVTTATVERLPIPQPGHSPAAERDIAALARLLSRRINRDAWIRLQAAVAALYQLTPAEFAHVLGTFPLIAVGDRDAARVAYEATEAQRTQR